jgi:hypothetical protein
VPFCILLFDSEAQNDEFSRAIFHNINSKQIPLRIEENRKVIIDSEAVFSDHTLETDPSFGLEYKCTRSLLKMIDMSVFNYINTYISGSKFTFFIDVFKYLMDNGTIPREEEMATAKVKQALFDIEHALRESDIVASTHNISVIGALAYYKLTNTDKYLHFIEWVKKNNIGNIEMIHINEVIDLYDSIYENAPKRAFLARWYPDPASENEAYRQAESRLAAIRELVQSFGLKLKDIGTQNSGTFDIRKIMYEEIRRSDIFIADLTGTRHNVMVEVGYALNNVDAGKMLFYFQPKDDKDRVPFDVNGFQYVEIKDSHEITTNVKPKLESILEAVKMGTL